jgi:prevent-host-death family protein
MKRVALSEIKDDLSKYLRLAESEEIVITRHGKPAGMLVGFGSEDDWFDYRLEHDPRFLARIAQARASLKAGKGIKLEELQSDARERPGRRRHLRRRDRTAGSR